MNLYPFLFPGVAVIIAVAVIYFEWSNHEKMDPQTVVSPGYYLDRLGYLGIGYPRIFISIDPSWVCSMSVTIESKLQDL